MRICSGGPVLTIRDGWDHEEIVFEDEPCPLCVAKRGLAKALAEVSRLGGQVEALQTRAVILTGRIR